jgi:hypothetical protein
MPESVIIAIISAISAGLPTVATIVTALIQARSNKRNFAKQSIFNLINDDLTRALYGRIPENYQNILDEYDQYHKNGGNSYVSQKVEDYKAWYVEWQKRHVDKNA